MRRLEEALVKSMNRKPEALQRLQLVEKTGNTFKQLEET